MFKSSQDVEMRKHKLENTHSTKCIPLDLVGCNVGVRRSSWSEHFDSPCCESWDFFLPNTTRVRC